MKLTKREIDKLSRPARDQKLVNSHRNLTLFSRPIVTPVG
jgi:hypothetical protein